MSVVAFISISTYSSAEEVTLNVIHAFERVWGRALAFDRLIRAFDNRGVRRRIATKDGLVDFFILLILDEIRNRRRTLRDMDGLGNRLGGVEMGC